MTNHLRVARTLLRTPGITLAAVLTLGLSLAANTALFSIFDGLLFRPLPFHEAGRIVYLDFPRDARRGLPRQEVSRLNDLRANTPLLEARALAEPAILFDEGAADTVAWGLRPARVSPNLFSLLGVEPVIGRGFTRDDVNAETPFSALRVDGQGWELFHRAPQGAAVGPAVVILAHDLWMQRFGGDRSLIGQRITMDGGLLPWRPLLIGVMPRGFRFPDGANLWVPANAGPARFNYGRLAGNVSVQQLRSVLPGHEVTSLRDHVRPSGAGASAVLMAGMVLLLIVAWVQIGALLFARTTKRISEIGIRLALGAGRGRLAGEFAVEGALLALLALGVASALVHPLTFTLVWLLPEEMTRGQYLTPDARTGLFAAAVSIAGVLLLVLGPLAVLRRSAPGELFTGRPFGSFQVEAGRLRSVLLAMQVAVTAALLYVCALTVHSFAAVSSVDLGFSPDRVIALQMPAAVRSFAGSADERRERFDRQVQQALDIRDAISVLPGVAGTAFGPVPFARDAVVFSDQVTIRPASGEAPELVVRVASASPNYPMLLGLQTVAGELPAHVPRSDEPPVAVNETLARLLAFDGGPVGQRLKGPQHTWRIAAVVSDFVSARPDRPVGPELLVLTEEPQAQIVVRMADGANTDAARAAIATTFERLYPDKASRDVIPVRSLAATATADYRARAIVMTLIGMLCVPLAIAGVAGAAAFSVQQRTREIAVRLALGASPRVILRGVVRDASFIVSAGIVAGVGAGVVIGRGIGSQLFGIRPADPPSVAAAAGALFIVGLAGAWFPARRAAATAPADALKEQW